jgi:hypothetical protein
MVAWFLVAIKNSWYYSIIWRLNNKKGAVKYNIKETWTSSLNRFNLSKKLIKFWNIQYLVNLEKIAYS